MHHFAANYIFNGRKLIKNAFVSVGDLGEIVYISPENEALIEKPQMSFYNGIISPGFINAHCHLELSDKKYSYIDPPGLSQFIKDVLEDRNLPKDERKISLSDRKMFENGISAVGDISNTNVSIDVKSKSNIFYKTFVELSGMQPHEAVERYRGGVELQQEFKLKGLHANITIHSFYSICRQLFDLVKDSNDAEIVSIHFLESSQENELFKKKSGSLYELMEYFKKDYSPICNTHECLSELLDQFNRARIILVHNVCLERSEIYKNGNVSYCLCPKSNLLLHNQLPKSSFVRQVRDSFVVGTDSLSSNDTLCVLSELKCLEENYTFLKLEELLKAATYNGAKALGVGDQFGDFVVGKKPGLILIENVDFIDMKLSNDAEVRRLI